MAMADIDESLTKKHTILTVFDSAPNKGIGNASTVKQLSNTYSQSNPSQKANPKTASSRKEEHSSPDEQSKLSKQKQKQFSLKDLNIDLDFRKIVPLKQ